MVDIDWLVIDGKNMAMRSYYAYPVTLSANGQPTNLIHGMLMELAKHVVQFRPARCVVVWDGRSTFRRTIFADYKARRPSLTSEETTSLHWQFARLERILETLPLRQLRLPDIEGDDLVAYIVRVVRRAKEQAVVVSTDHDFWQLVTRDVAYFEPRTKLLLTTENFTAETGFRKPGVFLAYKCLRGDHGDGVPGLRGFGEKTARASAEELAAVLPPPAKYRLPYPPAFGDRKMWGLILRNYTLVSLEIALEAMSPRQRVELDRWRVAGQPRGHWPAYQAECAKLQLKEALWEGASVFRQLGGRP